MKKPADPLTRVRVDRPDAVRRLTNIRSARFLFPFLGRESSIAEAAKELGVTIPRMSYQVRSLADVGLVAVTRIEPRAGRAVKYYRSVADEFTITVGDLGDGDLEQFLLDSEAPMREALARSLALSFGHSAIVAATLELCLRRLPDGAIDFSPMADGTALTGAGPGAFAAWTMLVLSDNDAEQLVQELSALWRRWRDRSDASRPTTAYLVRLAAAPVPTR